MVRLSNLTTGIDVVGDQLQPSERPDVLGPSMKAPSWFENSQAVGVVYLWGLLDTEKGSESGQSNPSGVSLYRATRCSDGCS
jgi:hypothetical protein